MAKKYKIIINAKSCKACGICIALCAKQVFTYENNSKAVPSNQDKCIGCHMCQLYCPDYCIEVEEVA